MVVTPGIACRQFFQFRTRVIITAKRAREIADAVTIQNFTGVACDAIAMDASLASPDSSFGSGVTIITPNQS